MIKGGLNKTSVTPVTKPKVNKKLVLSNKEFFDTKANKIPLIKKRQFTSISPKVMCKLEIILNEDFDDKYSGKKIPKNSKITGPGFFVELQIKYNERRKFIFTNNHIISHEILDPLASVNITYNIDDKITTKTIKLSDRYLFSKEYSPESEDGGLDVTVIEIKDLDGLHVNECLNINEDYIFKPKIKDDRDDKNDIIIFYYDKTNAINNTDGVIIGTLGDSTLIFNSFIDDDLSGCPIISLNKMQPKVVGIVKGRYKGDIVSKEAKFNMGTTIMNISDKLKNQIIKGIKSTFPIKPAGNTNTKEEDKNTSNSNKKEVATNNKPITPTNSEKDKKEKELKEKMEKEKLEKEKKEKMEKEKLEKQRKEQNDKLLQEKKEKEQKEKLDKSKQEINIKNTKEQNDIIDKSKQEKEQKEKIDKEKQEKEQKEKIDKETLNKEKEIEKNKVVQEKRERERRETLAAKALNKEKIEKEKKEKERIELEKQRVQREKMEIARKDREAVLIKEYHKGRSCKYNDVVSSMEITYDLSKKQRSKDNDDKDFTNIFGEKLKGINLSNVSTLELDGKKNTLVRKINFKDKNKHKLTCYCKHLVKDCASCFQCCTSLISIDFSLFNTEFIENMSYMFCDCVSLTNIDLSNFKTKNVKDMKCMFQNCCLLTNLDLCDIVTENVEDMSFMFSQCSSVSMLDLRGFETKKVKDMEGMFNKCVLVKKIDLEFNTENVRNMGYMFQDCKLLNVININKFITKNVEEMCYMFNGCSSVKNLDFSRFDTKNVKNMAGMFQNCESLTILDISIFDNSNVENMSYMFCQCSSLSKLYLSVTNSDKLKDISYMFDGCGCLSEVNLSKLNTVHVKSMENTFSGCSQLKQIEMDGSLNNLRLIDNMFDNVSALGTFIYNSKFNYYKIIHELPKKWIVKPKEF